MSIAEYFQEPNAERVLLVEIERNVSPAKTYYLSDGFYVTEPSDTPSNVGYSPVIGGSGLPEFRRTLNDPFTGNASTSFGNLELSDTDVAFTQGATKSYEEIFTPKGAKVRMFLAAPREVFPREDAVSLAVGTVQSFSGSTDGRYTIEISDNREIVAGSVLSVTDYPLTYGLVRNMTAVLADPAIRKYFVNQGAIESIDAVYDDGVLLSPLQYTVDLSNGSFILSNNPNGSITADVKGMKVGGVWLSTTQQIITDILSKAGVTGFTTEFSLASGTIGYLVKESVQLQTVLNDLCQGCGAYWLIDRTGILNFKTYPVVSGLGQVFTEVDLLSEAEYVTEENLFSTVNFTYKNNWTIQQPRVGASTVHSVFVQKPSEESEVSLLSVDSELQYTSSPVVRTYFDSLSDAESVGTAILNLFSTPRKYYSFTVPYINTLDLGSTCTIMVDALEATGVVTEVSDVFDGSYPTQRIKMIV
jgi:hypothetical protein